MYKTPIRAETFNRFKFLFPCLVLGFLMMEVYRHFQSVAEFDFRLLTIPSTIVLPMLLLVFLNLSAETLKWKSLMPELPFWLAYRSVLYGMKAGFVTPNRLGDFAGRLILLPSHQRQKAAFTSVIASFFQGLVTAMFGLFALLYFPNWPQIPLTNFNGAKITMALMGFAVLGALAYTFRGKLRKYYQTCRGHFKALSLGQAILAFGLATIRYAVFVVQFYFCLKVFGFSGSFVFAAQGIAVLYFIQSFIPLSTFGELGLREILAVVIFGSQMPYPWLAAIAALTMWFFNICLPILVGLVSPVFVKRSKLSNA